MDDDDDDLWSLPFVMQEDTFRKQTLRGCEFWFDCRTDVLEESFQNGRYCEQVWRILTEKKQDSVIDELERDSHVASSRSDDLREVIGSSDSDKTLSALILDADTSSAKSDLDEDENTSSISDAQTLATREDIDPDISLKPLETEANEPLTVEVVEDADTSSSPVFASKIEEVEEHSCSSLVTDQVVDSIKQAPENMSSSAISLETIGSSTLRPLLSGTREKVRDMVNATGEILKDQSVSLQDIVTVSEPFTLESLLDMCDEQDKGRETLIDENNKKSHPEALKTVVKDELIISLLTEEAESNASLKPSSFVTKKRRSKTDSSNRDMNTSFIRNTKQKVEGKASDIKTQLTAEVAIGSSIPKQDTDSSLDSIDGKSQGGGQIVSDLVISTSELKKKTGKELKSIAKALKVTHYYKLKKEDLLQRLTGQLNSS